MNSGTIDRIDAEVSLLRLLAKNGTRSREEVAEDLKQLRSSTACIVAALDQLQMELRDDVANVS